MNKINNPKNRFSERGQSLTWFMVLMPIFALAMVVVVDYGRFLVMSNQAKIYADNVATAAAGSLDVSESTKNRNFILNNDWAQFRGHQAWDLVLPMDDQLGNMAFTLVNIDVDGSRATATVHGVCNNTYASRILGLPGYSVTVWSTARSAAGITGDLGN